MMYIDPIAAIGNSVIETASFENLLFTQAVQADSVSGLSHTDPGRQRTHRDTVTSLEIVVKNITNYLHLPASLDGGATKLIRVATIRAPDARSSHPRHATKPHGLGSPYKTGGQALRETILVIDDMGQIETRLGLAHLIETRNQGTHRWRLQHFVPANRQPDGGKHVRIPSSIDEIPGPSR